MVVLSPEPLNTFMNFSLLFQFLDLISLSILLDHHFYMSQLSHVQKADLIAKL